MKNILLVGDDPWTRDSLALFFQIGGCRLHSVASGNEAIAAMAGHRFDMILSDESLPDMDGLSLLRLYGKNQPGAVMFLLSSYPTRSLVEEAGRCGIHDVIGTPFTVETLAKTMLRLFPRSHDRDREPVDVS